MSLAPPAQTAVARRFDPTWPILIGFAAVLCVLIVLPLSPAPAES